jgi:hypothetical protein
VTWIRANPLVALLCGFAGFAIAGLLVVFATIDSDERSDLWMEVGKGLIQVLAVVIFGAAVKLVADRYQERQAEAERARQALAVKAEQNRAFRQDKYDKLVETTNLLRKVQIHIDADPSKETWSEQMPDVIAAGLRLRSIKHQIYSSWVVEDRPFRDNAAIVWLFELMYHYTDWVTEDFAERVRDMRSTQEDPEGCREDLERRIEPLNGKARVEKDETPPMPAPSWLVYETAETLALEKLTDATLVAARW